MINEEMLKAAKVVPVITKDCVLKEDALKECITKGGFPLVLKKPDVEMDLAGIRYEILKDNGTFEMEGQEFPVSSYSSCSLQEAEKILKKDPDAVIVSDGIFEESIDAMAVRAFYRHVYDICLKHVGMNEEEGNGPASAQAAADLFRDGVVNTGISWFGSPLVEVMYAERSKGVKGHIGIGVNDVYHAMLYYEMLGYHFRRETEVKDDAGLKLIYFDLEVNGFAVHLVRK